MSRWREQRKASRLAVHRQFAYPAVYAATATSVPIRCTARYHTRIARFGDLDRGGFTEVVEDINQVTFLQSEIATPVRNATVTFPHLDRAFIIEMVDPPDDDVIVVCKVRPKNLTKPGR